MAQYYKVDNRFLNEEEYNEHCVGLWAVCLFIGGAILCGYYLHGMIPADWAKCTPSGQVGQIAGYC